MGVRLSAARLRAARERAGLTQEELARRAQLSSTTVARAERADAQRHPQTVRGLAEALGLETPLGLLDDADREAFGG